MNSPGFATLQITISDGGSIETSTRRFATWGMAVQDLSEAWDLIGQRLLADNMLNIIGSGSLYAGGWEPLATSTITERLRQGFGAGPTMWRTGRLARSLSQRGAEGNIFAVTPTSLTVGSDVEYAGFQHWGTARIPARPLVGVSWDTQQFIVRTLADTIREKARSAGFETTDD